MLHIHFPSRTSSARQTFLFPYVQDTSLTMEMVQIEQMQFLDWQKHQNLELLEETSRTWLVRLNYMKDEGGKDSYLLIHREEEERINAETQELFKLKGSTGTRINEYKAVTNIFRLEMKKGF